MLTENKFGKYLLYAIGEIVLVVIGILIALNINNWNEKKITKEKERFALEEIKSDLELNTNSLIIMIDTDAHSINNTLNSIDIIITNLEETKIYHDSLAKHFWNVFHYPDMIIKSSGYESLTSIGMDLISDQHLRSEIGKFYTYTVPSTRSAYNEVRDDFYHYMLDFLTSNFISESLDNGDIDRIPHNYNELVNRWEFTETLKVYAEVFEFFREQALLTLNECEKLHKKIAKKMNE